MSTPSSSARPLRRGSVPCVLPALMVSFLGARSAVLTGFLAGFLGLRTSRWPQRRASIGEIDLDQDRPVAQASRVDCGADLSVTRPDGGDVTGAVSVVVVTHNDGPNLPVLLARLLREPDVAEVLVVASGCEDDTVASVSAAGQSDSRVQLWVEAERSGKIAAINHGLRTARGDIVVMVSGDVLPEPGAVRRLVAALDTPGAGIAGGRPVPVNDPATFMGHTTHLLWRLHHRLALCDPKIGEIAAVRAEAVQLLPPTAVDEAWLQAQLARDGWDSRYVPEVVIANRGPDTVRDFVAQRRRVHAGHLWLRSRAHYTVPSLRAWWLVREVVRDTVADVRTGRMRGLAFTSGAVVLEAYARLLARTDHLSGREAHVWDMVESAKAPAIGAHRGDAGARQPVA